MTEILTVLLQRGPKGFGFALCGPGPCLLHNVYPGGVAATAGLRNGDLVLGLNGRQLGTAAHADVAAVLAEAADRLQLSVQRDRASLDVANPVLSARLKGSPEAAEWTDQSSLDSDSQVWRQQRAESESRIATTSLHRPRPPPPLPPPTHHHRSQFEDLVKPYTSALSVSMHAHPGPGSRSERMRRKVGSGYASTSSLSRRRRDPDGPNSGSLSHLLGDAAAPRHPKLALHEPNNNNVGSLPSSLRRQVGGGGRRASKSSLRRGETRASMNRSRSEPDFGDNVSGMADVASDRDDDAQSVRSSSSSSSSAMPEDDYTDLSLLFKCVLVYIGAVPVNMTTEHRRVMVRKALTNLRAQSTRAITVVMQIYSDCVIVTNSRRVRTHLFPAANIVSGTACEENKQYFGLFVTHGEESRETAVCHMFAVDSELHMHYMHKKTAEKFGIKCSRDPGSGFCLEFPYISSPLLSALAHTTAKNRAPPKTAALKGRGYSSASDSGIDRRDERRILSGGLQTVSESCGLSDASSRGSNLRRPESALRKKADSSSGLKVTFEEPLPSKAKGVTGCVSSCIAGSAKLYVAPPAHPIKELGSGCGSLSGVVGRSAGGSPDSDAAAVFGAARDDDMKSARDKEPDFDNILQHPNLRKPFQEFLEQQFCQENLGFWLAVEEYRAAPEKDRARLGRHLYDTHFAPSCLEPVNVDSTAMTAIKDAAAAAHFHPTLFNTAQYQIFHLMKYDVWPRFLKDKASSSVSVLEKKGSIRKHKDEPKQESKRKSLLPWKNLRVGKRKEAPGPGGGGGSARGPNPTPVSSFLGTSDKENADGEEKKRGWRSGKQHSMPAQVIDTVSAPGPSGLSRGSDAGFVRPVKPPADPPTPLGPPVIVVYPDGNRENTTLCEPDQSTRDWLRERCAAKSLALGTMELLDQSGEIILGAGSPEAGGKAAVALANRTVRLSPLVHFFVDIPASSSSQGSDKRIRVQARPDDQTGQVLRPVLAAYGLELDSLVVGLSGTTEVLPNSAPIRRADGRKLFLLSPQEFADWMHSDGASSSCPSSPASRARRFPSLSSASSAGSGGLDGLTPLASLQGAAFLELPARPKAPPPLLPRLQSISQRPPTKMASLEVEGSAMGVDFRQPSSSCSIPSSSAPTDEETVPESSGMLKYVRKGGNGSRKSLDPPRPTDPALAAKRATIANSQELRNQMKQDTALSEIMGRVAPRLDDATSYELPEFLRPKNPPSSVSPASSRPSDASWDEGFPPGTSMDPTLMGPEDGILATPSKGERVFGSANSVDFNDPEMTSRRQLGDYGLGGGASSLEASFVTAPDDLSNVSVVSVGGLGRGPPPAYPGRLCATNLEKGSRTPVYYLSPQAPKAGSPSEATLLKADYV